MVPDVYFLPSSAHFSVIQQNWLARMSVRQLSPLIRHLAGRGGVGGMGVLAGSCPWQGQETDAGRRRGGEGGSAGQAT